MKYVLAIVAFIIAVPLLATFAINAFELSKYFREKGFPGWGDGVVFPLAIIAGSFLIGMAFVTAGIMVLSSKSKRDL